MSKSLGEKHYVNLFGEAEKVKKQVKTAVTDSGETAKGEMSAGVKNLFELLRACGNMEAHDRLKEDFLVEKLQYGALKGEVGESLLHLIEPFKAKLDDLNARRDEVEQQIRASSAQIRKVAQQTIKEVRELTGL